LAENQGKSTEKTAGKAANVIMAVCKKTGIQYTLKEP
jgi:hypothetical protein